MCDWPETRLKQTPRGEFGRTSFTIAVSQLRRTTEWQTATGKVLVHLDDRGERTAIAYGDAIELAGGIDLPPAARNPGQFDYRRYLARQDVHYHVRLVSTNDLQVQQTRQGNWIMQIAADANEHFKRCLALGIEGETETVGLLWAIVLGFRPGLTNELSEPFMRTGTLHVFAVSGFHIAMVGAILVVGLRLCRMSRTWSGLGSIPLLLIYTLVTGAPPSATRSFIMASMVLIGYSLLRPSDIYNSLAAAALVILAWNPQQLFDAGFQLSFFVVLTIAVFTPPVHDRMLRWAKPDPFLPWDVVPKWRRRIFYPLSKVLLFVAASFAAVVGSVPLIAAYFHLVTPIALVSNLLIVPLSGCIITLGFISSVTGNFLPWATELFNNANFALLTLTVKLTQWLADVPFGSFYVRTPPWPILAGYYLVITALLGGWAWHSRARRIATGIASLTLVVATVLVYTLPGPATVTVLDVGGAQAVVVNQPGHNDLLVDGGRRSHGDGVVQHSFRTQGIRKLGAILLTVNDINHAGGLIPIASKMPFDQFWASSFKSRSREYRELMEQIGDSGRCSVVHAGNEFRLDPAIHLRVLHPPSPSALSTADDNSVVVQLECRGVRFLFKSEIGETVERELAVRADLRSHILVTGQHPKEPSCTDGFLNAVQPELVVLCSGSFPAYAYPRPDLVARIQRRGIKLMRTDECGGIVITPGNGNYRAEPTIPQSR